MRKIKNNVFMVLSLLPLLIYLFVVFRSGTAPDFLTTVTTALGDFGEYFSPTLITFLSNFVPLADSAGIAVVVWLFGYYVTLLMVFIVFSAFTFLITIFLNKIDNIRGVK